jgi:hypothetical protein
MAGRQSRRRDPRRLVQRRRDRRAAAKLMRKLMRKQGFAPKKVVTDKLRSCHAAFSTSGFLVIMSRACDRTIGPRVRTRWCDDESASCSASNHRATPSDSSACMPLSTTHSTFSGISSLAQLCGSSDQMRLRNGAARPRPYEAEPDASHLGRKRLNLTMPLRMLPMWCAAAAELRVGRRRHEAADLSREQAGEFDRRPVLTLRPDDLQAHR